MGSADRGNAECGGAELSAADAAAALSSASSTQKMYSLFGGRLVSLLIQSRLYLPLLWTRASSARAKRSPNWGQAVDPCGCMLVEKESLEMTEAEAADAAVVSSSMVTAAAREPRRAIRFAADLPSTSRLGSALRRPRFGRHSGRRARMARSSSGGTPSRIFPAIGRFSLGTWV